MLRIALSTLFLFSVCIVSAQTLQEKLGYSKDTKLVIVHADDLGVAHSENIASIEALEKGIVNSASIMVPCPWFPEIAEYARNNLDADLGLHLTLNCEWDFYKWSSVTPNNEVSSLLDGNGYLYSTTDAVVNNATPEEVEKELRNQIERAKQFGMKPTHFDAHMGTAMSSPEFVEIYLRLGKEYNTPVFVPARVLEMFDEINYQELMADKDIVVDHVLSASPQDFEKGMKEFYINGLKSLKPGLTYFILHTAYEDEEMTAVTKNHPYWAADWRQQDFDFVMSDEAKKIIEDENIQLITWKEIGKKLLKNK